MEFSIVTISAFVATLNELTKLIFKDVFKKDINRFIPLFSIGYGIILGLIAWFVHIPDFGNNVIEAVFIGLSSGAAATGYHQIGKQLSKNETTTIVEDDIDGFEDEDGVESIDDEDIEFQENDDE